MEFKQILALFLLRVPSYAYSHIYDIVVYEIGILAAVIICFVKDPIKKANRKSVYRKTGIDIKAKRTAEEEKSFDVKSAVMLYRRHNMIVAFMAGVLSEILYLVFAYNSARIKEYTWWNIIAFITPIAVYSFIEQLISHWIGPFFCVIMTVGVFYANRYYCLINENHHKTCYAIKALVVIFGVLGILLQFLVRKKYNKPVKEYEDRLDLGDTKKMEEFEE